MAQMTSSTRDRITFHTMTPFWEFYSRGAVFVLNVSYDFMMERDATRSVSSPLSIRTCCMERTYRRRGKTFDQGRKRAQINMLQVCGGLTINIYGFHYRWKKQMDQRGEESSPSFLHLSHTPPEMMQYINFFCISERAFSSLLWFGSPALAIPGDLSRVLEGWSLFRRPPGEANNSKVVHQFRAAFTPLPPADYYCLLKTPQHVTMQFAQCLFLFSRRGRFPSSPER